MVNLKIKQIKAENTWPMRQSIMYPEFSIAQVMLEKDNEGLHFGGFIGKELTCVVSLFIENNEAQFRKLATKQKFQEKGFGTKMMHHILDLSIKKGATKFWCNARVNKTNFYHKFGLRITDKTYTKSGIDFVIMERNLKHII